uniref:Uncharacterized protein n=1 Tax=Cucumis sativus TaxID=3659 RepID=A0A0A0K8G9_CUCSA
MKIIIMKVPRSTLQISKQCPKFNGFKPIIEAFVMNQFNTTSSEHFHTSWHWRRRQQPNDGVVG